MRVEGLLGYGLPADPVAAAAVAASAGYTGLWAGGGGPESLLRLAVAGTAAGGLRLGTGIVLAFPFNPMTLALAGLELQRLSGTQVVVGLGSQMRSYVEHRYGTAFDPPLARMRDFISAVRAIWDAAGAGTAVDYHGRFYHHVAPPPPPPSDGMRPLIGLAAVGPRMTALAGELCDVVLLHGSTAKYIADISLPALQAVPPLDGPRARCEVWNSCLAAGGDDAAVRRYLSHIVSTGAYRRVFELHGWTALHDAVYERVRSGDANGAIALVTDGVVDAFAVVAADTELGPAIRRRFEPLVDTVGLCLPGPIGGTALTGVVRSISAKPARELPTKFPR